MQLISRFVSECSNARFMHIWSVHVVSLLFFPFVSEIKLLLSLGRVNTSIKLENKAFLKIQNVFLSLSHRGRVSPRDR